MRIYLLQQNRVGRYLVYALGEILLVVIGILIALQVNNWNEERKAVKEGNLIKQNIHEEFIKNQALLKESIRLNEAALNAGTLLINLVGLERSELAKHNVDSLINSSLLTETYLPSSNSLQDIRQSGRMNLLNDPKLKNIIFAWNSDVDIFREYNQIQTNWYNNQYFPYILPIVSVRQANSYNNKSWSGKSKLKTDYYPMFQDIKFENIIENNLFLIDYLITKQKDIEQHQRQIIELTNPKL